MQADPQLDKEQNFSTFGDELEHIQERVAESQATWEVPPTPEQQKEIISDEIETYKEKPTTEVLHPDFQMQADEIETKVIELDPGHDSKIDELIALMGEKGLKNTLAVLERLGNYHISDDFHRFLIQYVAQGLNVSGLKEGSPMFKALNMQLFEVTLPEMGVDSTTRSFADLVRAMEQFYIGMMSLKENDKVMNHFTIELALSNYSSDLIFYAAVPRIRAELFEKHLVASFPNAMMTERKDDYNPFNENGVTIASIAELTNHRGFPLKLSEEFEQDPLNVILGTFSKMNKDGEGAAIQLSIAPSGNDINKEFNEAIKRMKNGEVLSDAFSSTGMRVTKEIFSMASGIFSSTKPGEEKELPEVNEEAIEKITQKMQSPILRTNLRLVASSGTQVRAEQILSQIESAFIQFSKQQSNRLFFKRRTGARLKQLLHNYTFRLFADKEELLLNTKELTAMMHFPVTTLNSPELKNSSILTAAAPITTQTEGVILGINNHRGNESEIRMAREDRVRHFYMIGQTGTGKTNLFKNMIIQDIENGEGVCYMDPHGSDIEDIMERIPEHRKDDVIYFDPSDTTRPMGLNMLEYDINKPEQKAFVVNEMLSIFNKLFDMKTAGGPMFEQYFRNATMLVMEDPDTGNTLLDISRVMADEEYRNLKISHCKNQIVKQFWVEIAGKAGGDASLANMVPYITNKFDVFLANDVMRMIFVQEQSAFNMREVMDNKKILLVNLAKGRLGELNSHLIGLILVGKVLMAALSRVDALGTKPADFYLYIDEFQNVTTDSISAILSEARKYRLSLNIAHQYIAQLPDDIKDAVFGNVGSMAAFRIGAEDAEFLESQFAPTFSAADMMKTPNWNAYVKMLVNGLPMKPFNIATMAPSEGNPERAKMLKQLSSQKYGVDREVLEQVIAKKYEEKKKPAEVKKPAVQGIRPVPSQPAVRTQPQTRTALPVPSVIQKKQIPIQQNTGNSEPLKKSQTVTPQQAQTRPLPPQKQQVQVPSAIQVGHIAPLVKPQTSITPAPQATIRPTEPITPSPVVVTPEPTLAGPQTLSMPVEPASVSQTSVNISQMKTNQLPGGDSLQSKQVSSPETQKNESTKRKLPLPPLNRTIIDEPEPIIEAPVIEPPKITTPTYGVEEENVIPQIEEIPQANDPYHEPVLDVKLPFLKTDSVLPPVVEDSVVQEKPQINEPTTTQIAPPIIELKPVPAKIQSVVAAPPSAKTPVSDVLGDSPPVVDAPQSADPYREPLI